MTKTTTVTKSLTSAQTALNTENARLRTVKKFWRFGMYSWIINIGAEHQHTHFACVKFINGKFDCLVIHKNIANNFHLDCIISGKSFRDAVTEYMSRYLSYHEILNAVYGREITR